MTPIFGHLTDKPHGKLSELALALSSPARTNVDRALGKNLMHDDRVSETRAERFYEWAGMPVDEAGLMNALDDYLLERVRADPDGTFLNSAENTHNLVSTAPPALAHVIDFTWLLPDLRRMPIRGIPEVPEFSASELITDADMDRLLGDALSDMGTQRQESLVKAVLDAVNAGRNHRPRNPTWAADWDTFVSCTNETAESWLEAVGIPRPTHPRWVMVLKYSSTDASPLARPSQLDVGSFAYHFPSPAAALCELGGHPMSLTNDPVKRRSLIGEFVHRQIDFDVRHWRDGGLLLAKTMKPAGLNADLATQRSRHHRLLKSKYGDPLIDAWMPECT